MSRYAEVITKIKDQGLLCAALTQMGFHEVESHVQAQTLFGYHGDARNERAEVIIRRQYIGSASNDIGFVRDKATGVFKAIISDFDRSSKHYNNEWLGKLNQAYVEQDQMAIAKERGLAFIGREVQSNGAVTLLFALDEPEADELAAKTNLWSTL